MVDDAAGQTYFWKLGHSHRRPATDDEKHAALNEGVTMALRHHHGPVPRVCGIDGDWIAFRATMIENAWSRLRHFEHGGNKTIKEFAYIAVYFALRDIQREMMKDTGQIKQPKPTPLLDYAECA